MYWLFVICSLFVLRFREVKGHYPLLKAKAKAAPADDAEASSHESGSDSAAAHADKSVATEKTVEAQV